MSEIKIKSTTEYNKFKFFNDNRTLNESLVKKLMGSINQIGFITGRPVIVDNHYCIIDGQHRFEACKRLGLPIYYEIIKTKDSHEVMIQLNSKQLQWKIQDYVHSWAEKGIKCYQKLEEFEATHKLGISNSIIIFFGGDDGANVSQFIREGKIIKINPEAESIAQFLKAAEIVPYGKSSHFVKGVCRVFKKSNEAQREKILKYLISLPAQASAAAYVTAFENLVNKGVQNKNHISFTAVQK